MVCCPLLLLALISYVPAFNAFFGTAPLAPWQLALSLPLDELERSGTQVVTIAQEVLLGDHRDR